MTEQECKQKILDALYEFEDTYGVHITSVSIPTRHSINVYGKSYEILEPRIEYESNW